MFYHIKLDKNRTIRAFFGPTIVEAKDGTLLVFAQGRINSSEDGTEKVIVQVRSFDGGKTWTSPRVIADPKRVFHELQSYVNPRTGRIWNYTQGIWDEDGGTKFKMMRIYSDDNGETWSDVNENIIDWVDGLYLLNDKGVSWTGLQLIGQAILLKGKKYFGRMVLTGNGRAIVPGCRGSKRANVSWYSDDYGETWTIGNPQTNVRAGENTVVELKDGRLMMIIRPPKGDTSRYKSYSHDGGVNWTIPERTKDIEPVNCYQSITRYSGIGDGKKSLLLYTQPKNDLRMLGSLYWSFDEGESWKRKTLVWGFFDYSNVRALRDGRIAVVYSRGGHGPFGLNIAIFRPEWFLK